MSHGDHFYQLECSRLQDQKIAQLQLDLTSARTEVDLLKQERRNPPVDHREALRDAVAEVKTVREKIDVIYSFGATPVPPTFKKKICYEVGLAKKQRSAPPYLRSILDLLLLHNNPTQRR